MFIHKMEWQLNKISLFESLHLTVQQIVTKAGCCINQKNIYLVQHNPILLFSGGRHTDILDFSDYYYTTKTCITPSCYHYTQYPPLYYYYSTTIILERVSSISLFLKVDLNLATSDYCAKQYLDNAVATPFTRDVFESAILLKKKSNF